MNRLKNFFWVFPPAVALLLYWPVLGFGLVWDDFEIINDLLPLYQTAGDAITQKGLFGLPHFYYRPLMFLSLMLDRWLWGSNLLGFHATLLFLHAASTLLVYFITTLLLRGRKEEFWIAFAASLLFAVHPIHTEVVAWISARPDALMSFWVLFSFLLFLFFRNSPQKKIFLHLSSLAFFFSLLSKETAALFLPCILCYDFCFPLLKKRSLFYRHQIGFYLPFLFYFILRRHYVGRNALPLSLGEGFVAALGKAISVLGFYFQKVVFPDSLNAFVAVVPMKPHFYFGLLFLAGGIGLGLKSYHKGERIISFHLFFFFLTLLPAVAITFFPVARTVVAERYLYLPSYPFCFLAAFWFFKKPLGYKVFLFAALIGWSGYKSFTRLPAWQNELVFWQVTSRQNLEWGLPYFNLGLAHKRQNGDLEEAMKNYEKALEAKYDSQGRAIVHNSIGLVHLDRMEFDEAENHFKKALEERPFPYPFCNLGRLYYRKGLQAGEGGEEFLDKSLSYFQECVERTPGNPLWRREMQAVREVLKRKP